MKGHLFIQRRKGKQLEDIESYYVDLSGGENKHGRKVSAVDHSWLIAEIYITDMQIDVNGIKLKGYELEGDRLYFQEWWVQMP